MEIVRILRVLRRHRLLVGVGLVPAIVVALSMMYRLSLLPPKLESRTTHTGTASARLLLSAKEQRTPQLEAAMNEMLPAQASLLADRLASDESRARIARDAALPPDDVAIYGPSADAPPVAVPLAVEAREAAGLSTEMYRLTTSTQGRVSIIVLRARGPDSAGAAKVVDAAAVALAELVPSDSADAPGLVLERLGPAVGVTRVDRPKLTVALFAALTAFVLWSSAIVLLSGIARRWRVRGGPRPARA